jgi:heme exporter protein B
LRAAAVLFRRELSLAWAKGGGPLLSVGFLAAVTTLLPLALGPAPARLAGVAAGATWVGLALATLLGLERMFESDLEDGALDILALGPLPLEIVCAVKCLATWLATGLPLALAAPIAALTLGESARGAPLLLIVALLGGLSFAFVGGTGAALALVSRRGGVLLALIVLPLLTPPVIFGGAVLSAPAGAAAGGLALLAAYALAAVALTPSAMAAACRNALD